GKAIGIVQAYFLPLRTITSSSSTRSHSSRVIGPVNGDSPPSPILYKLERSASLSATFFACVPTSSRVRLTGSLSPACGEIRSAIGPPCQGSGVRGQESVKVLTPDP